MGFKTSKQRKWFFANLSKNTALKYGLIGAFAFGGGVALRRVRGVARAVSAGRKALAGGIKLARTTQRGRKAVSAGRKAVKAVGRAYRGGQSAVKRGRAAVSGGVRRIGGKISAVKTGVVQSIRRPKRAKLPKYVETRVIPNPGMKQITNYQAMAPVSRPISSSYSKKLTIHQSKRTPVPKSGPEEGGKYIYSQKAIKIKKDDSLKFGLKEATKGSSNKKPRSIQINKDVEKFIRDGGTIKVITRTGSKASKKLFNPQVAGTKKTTLSESDRVLRNLIKDTKPSQRGALVEQWERDGVRVKDAVTEGLLTKSVAKSRTSQSLASRMDENQRRLLEIKKEEVKKRVVNRERSKRRRRILAERQRRLNLRKIQSLDNRL